MEKWKSKTRIPTFPPPRQPAAARRKTINERTPRPVFGAKDGDTSKEVWRFRSAPPEGQGVIVVDRRVDSSLLLPYAARCLMKNVTRPNERDGGRLRGQLSVTTRRELIDAVTARYRAGGRNQKKKILDEFVKVTGFHRKHAIRALRKVQVRYRPTAAGPSGGGIWVPGIILRRAGLRLPTSDD